MPHDAAFQADISLRLIAAAFFGAVIGLERELHGHPAGMRTHMLVALGAAIFTVLSIYAFPQVPGSGSTDPSRVAAQVVTGIGFLGAGAIVKYGSNIRGLTTAASLWVVAAVGLAAGAQEYLVAAVGSIIAAVALWPLHLLVQRLEVGRSRQLRLRIKLRELEAFNRISQALVERGIEIMAIQTVRLDGAHQMDLELRLPRAARAQGLLADLGSLGGVEVQTMSQTEEA